MSDIGPIVYKNLERRLGDRNIADVLAEANIGERTLSNWKNGSVKPRKQRVRKLLGALGLDEHQIIDELISIEQEANELFDQASTLQTSNEVGDANVCLFRGLEPFRTSDAVWFAGRDEEISQLKACVEAHWWTGVIAASGAGKTSLVTAGLLPQLVGDEGRGSWQVFDLRPGDEPLKSLSKSLAKALGPYEDVDNEMEQINRRAANLEQEVVPLSDLIDRIHSNARQGQTDQNQNILIFVDQWEDLYKPNVNERQRTAFVRELNDVADRGLARVLLTMRADFMGDMLSQDREFFGKLKPGLQYLAPMSRDNVLEAIQRPCYVSGLTLQDGLAQRLVDDAGSESGYLAYLQFTLTQLWKNREGAMLTQAAYDDIGGLRGAIGKHADFVVNHNLTASEKALARIVLPQLVYVSDRGKDISIRQPFSKFGTAGQKLFQKLASQDSRLVILHGDSADPNETTVEVAHEALLREWGELRDWVSERESFHIRRGRLEIDATRWLANSRSSDYLIPTGKPLLDADNLLGEALEGELSLDLVSFISQSKSANEARQEAIQLARQKRQKTLSVVTGASIISAIVFAAVAWFAYSQSEALNTSNNELQLASEELTQINTRLKNTAKDLEKSRNEAEAARDLAEENAATAQQALALAVARELASKARENLAFEKGNIELAALLATQSLSSAQTVEGVAVWTEIMNLLPDIPVRMFPNLQLRKAIYSTDGQMMAVLSDDENGQSYMTVQNVDTGSIVLKYSHASHINDLSFTETGLAFVAQDRVVQIIDLETGKPTYSKTMKRSAFGVTALAGDRLLLRQRARDILLDPATDKELVITDPGGIGSLFVSRDGRIMVNRANVAKPPVAEVRDPLDGSLTCSRNVSLLSDLNPDGTLVVVEENKKLGLMRTQDCQIVEELPFSEKDSFDALKFTQDGKHVVMARRQSIELWDIRSKNLSQIQLNEPILAFSLVAPTAQDLHYQVMNPSPNIGGASEFIQKQSNRDLSPRDFGRAEAFVVDANFLAVRIEDARDGHFLLRLWDRKEQRLTRNIPLKRGGGAHMRLLGDRLYVVEETGVAIFSAKTGQKLTTLEKPVECNCISALAVSPSGKYVAAASIEGYAVWVWEVGTGEVVSRVMHDDWVGQLYFTTDEGPVLAKDRNGVARMWDIHTGNEQFRIMRDGGDLLQRSFASADGSQFAVENGGRLRLWSIDGQQFFDRSFGKELAPYSLASFSDDGKYLALNFEDDRGFEIWDAAKGVLIRKIGTKHAFDTAFLPAKTRIAAAHSDSVVVYDFDDGKAVTQFQVGEKVSNLIASSDGNLLAFAAEDNKSKRGVFVADVDVGEIIAWLPHSDEGVKSIEFRPGQEEVATTTNSGKLRRWRNLRPSAVLGSVDVNRIYEVVLTSDSKHAVIRESFEFGGSDVTWATAIDLIGDFSTRRLDHGSGLTALDASADGRLAATAALDNQVIIWNIEDAKPIARFELEKPAASLLFSPNGKQIAVFVDAIGSPQIYNNERPGRIELWDIDSLSGPIWQISGFINDFRFSADGQSFFTAEGNIRRDDDSEETNKKLGFWGVRSWNAQSGKLISRFAQRERWPGDIYISPDGSTIAVNSPSYFGNKVRFLGSADLRLKSEIEADSDLGFDKVDFDPNWFHVLSSFNRSEDSILVMDASDGNLLSTLNHEAIVSPHGRAFTPSGNYVALESDGKVWLWDWREPRALAVFGNSNNPQFTSDGTKLIVQDGYSGVRAVSWEREDMIQRLCGRLERGFTDKEWELYLQKTAKQACPKH